MRVSLFGLFLRCTSLMEPWPKLVWSVLLVIGFIGFYRFYVSLGDNWCRPIYFISRLVTFPYFIISWVFPAWYHLLCIYLLLHDYDSVLSILMYPCQHAIWLLPHHSLGEFWLLWILMSRSWSLDRRRSSCWGPSLLLWSRQISCSSSPILAPPVGSRLL